MKPIQQVATRSLGQAPGLSIYRHSNWFHGFLFADSGVYLAEKINIYLAEHWKVFASRNYFDRAGVFISVVWSGPLVFISIVTVVSSLITLCQLMVKWKRAELRHRVRLAHDKEE
ncbi:unnamed protein product [Triticum turgidum subsp. durum]|uniref:Transmembrane protein 18 n=1 Tax=Triticum turgidum subsp. durum TaxID=4567 RepID=A0A9R0QYC3_TRITD|nr:unnamed protein product [Triticum turgidum subsp. durum]